MKRWAIIVLVIVLAVSISIGYLTLPQKHETRISLNGVVITVDLAETSAEQTKGLSGRESLAADHGMLFVFNRADYWGFWMTEMKFPLDIIWFNSDRQAVFIEQNLPPCIPQSCPVYTPTQPAKYVLEVNAGFVMAHIITLGDSFTFLS